MKMPREVSPETKNKSKINVRQVNEVREAGEVNEDLNLLNLDDDVQIKLINNGLGFHQEEEMDKYLHTFKPSASAKVNPFMGSTSLNSSTSSTSLRSSMSSISSTSSLSSRPGPLLNNKTIMKQESTNKIEARPMSSTATSNAPVASMPIPGAVPLSMPLNKGIQFLAFAIDISIILLTEFITIAVFFFILRLHFPISVILRPLQDLLMVPTILNLHTFFLSLDISVFIYFSAIFLIYYFFYFGFLDLTKRGTIGKSIFKLKLVSTNNNKNKSLEIHIALLRSVVVLSSTLALCLPLFFDFQGKLSGSKLIRSED
ncbi:MAG: RDD family protein [Oligoflexia bacterium]|nr:RDD family protein [Oligoflexia bacterium]